METQNEAEKSSIADILVSSETKSVEDPSQSPILCPEIDHKVSFSISTPTAEETPCCRVCHGESEPDNQLFFPCKCDGSIKYVHQNCLVEWLKVKRRVQHVAKPRCELCGVEFVFQNVYAANAPTRLTVFEIIRELMPRILEISKSALNIGLAIFLWILWLPTFTSSVIKICWCLVLEEVVDGIRQDYCFYSSFPSLHSFESMSYAWYDGIMNLGVIVIVSFVCSEIGSAIYRVSIFSCIPVLPLY